MAHGYFLLPIARILVEMVAELLFVHSIWISKTVESSIIDLLYQLFQFPDNL